MIPRQRTQPHRAGHRVRLLLLSRILRAAGAFGIGIDLMVNATPETVSTDYDTSDRLYFEPLTLEHVLPTSRYRKWPGDRRDRSRQSAVGTDARLTLPLPFRKRRAFHHRDRSADIDLGTKILKLFRQAARESGNSVATPNGTATSVEEACDVGARRLGYPVLVRPSML